MDYLARYTRADFRVDTFRGTGPGGQHRNKTDSAVRITHLPSGLSVAAQRHRSQHQNRAEAFRRLAIKVLAWVRAQHTPTPAVADPYRGFGAERRRTYHEPDNRVTDHVTGVSRPYQPTLDGDLEPFIRAAHGAPE